MSNFINNTQGNFTIIQNELLNRKDISFEIKGLYCFLISKPSGWSFSAEKISYQTKEGVSSIKRMLKELEDIGLLKRHKIKNDSGVFSGVHYEIFSTMVVFSADGETADRLSVDGKHDNISNTINSKKEREESEQSSDNTLLFNLDVTNQSQEVKLTKALFDLFRKNQKEKGVTVFTRYDKSKLSTWLPHIEKMIKIDGVTYEDFKILYTWLGSNYREAEFWKKNILSTQKLREQYPKLQQAINSDAVLANKLKQEQANKFKNKTMGL